MPRRLVAAWVVLFVVLNAGAAWYLRERMSAPPPAPASTSTPPPNPTDPTTPTPTVESEINGMVFLSGAPEGSVLRLTRGDCSDADPSVVGWIAAGEQGPEKIDLPDIAETVAVGRTATAWWVIGTDDRCEVHAWASESFEGDVWSETRLPAKAWHLDPQDPTRVISPKGPVGLDEDCEATWVQAVAERVYLICSDGQARVADQAVPEFATFANGVAALAVGPSGRLAQLTTGGGCLAKVSVVIDREILSEHCFGNTQAPLGIAWTGDDLVAQVGYDLVGNAGGAWEIRP